MLVASTVACEPDTDLGLGDWCVQAGGPSIPECTQLHADEPALRMPGGGRIGAITRGGDAFVTADGSLPIDQSLVDRGFIGGSSGEYANALYKATIADGTVVDVERVATVNEDVLLAAVFGGVALEGTIGRWVTTDTYSFEETLPIRFEFDTVAADGKLTAADGRCLAALSESDGNPLVGSYTADVWIARVPGMHGPFDDELVLHWNESVSNMGPGFYPSVATLAGKDPLMPTWDTALHGNPSYGPPVSLAMVDGGGEAC
jgi:hypothetical protein